MKNTRSAHSEAVTSAVDQMRRLMNATFEGAVLHDSGMVLDANRAAAELFGRAVPELNCCRISELLREESCRLLMRQIHSRRNDPCCITAIRKDGSSVPLEITVKATLTCQGRQMEMLIVSEMKSGLSPSFRN